MQKNTLVMIQSMTGYGKASATFGDKKINVEIKSLNSKAMDLSTRIAPLYREKEIEIRNMVSKIIGTWKSGFQPVDRKRSKYFCRTNQYSLGTKL